MKSAARRLAAHIRQLAAEMTETHRILGEEWAQPLDKAFREAARLQGQRSNNTMRAMLHVFATVHRFMRLRRPALLLTMSSYEARTGRVTRASARLSASIRKALRVLRCVPGAVAAGMIMASEDEAIPTIDDLDLDLSPEDLITAEPPSPNTVPGRNELAFLARMAVLNDEKKRHTVTDDEKKKAAATCHKAKAEIEDTLRRLVSSASVLSKKAVAVEKIASEAAKAIDTARLADRHRHRINVIYEQD